MAGTELFPIVTDAAKPIGAAIGGTLADIWQGILGDRVTAWRIRNAASINVRLGKYLETTEQALNLDKLPESVAYAWFQRATEADEPEIQDLFAKLLANAGIGNAEALKKRNIDLISRLTPDDARLLKAIADRRAEHLNQRWARPFSIDVDFMFPHWLAELGLADSDALDALLSLGIMRSEQIVGMDAEETSRAIQSMATGKSGLGWPVSISGMVKTKEALCLTKVGSSLVEALYPTIQTAIST